MFVAIAFIPEVSELLATIPIFCSPLPTIIFPLFIAFGEPPAALSVMTFPKSTLIPIFLLPETEIVPPATFLISSLSLTFKNIPVLPCPPETLIAPLFLTKSVYALIPFNPVKSSSSTTAIPDEREAPPLPLIDIEPLFSKTDLVPFGDCSKILEESFKP